MKYFIKQLKSLHYSLKVIALVLPMLALMLTTGCVSHPSASTVQSWPAQPPTGYSMLMMYWTKTRWDQGGGGPWIYIDDVKAFKLHVNHYTWIYVRAGQHNFSIMWGFKIFGWNPVNGLNMNKDMSFEDGENYYLRLRNWGDGGMYVEKIYVSLSRVSEQTAKKEATTSWFSKPLVGQIDDVGKQSEATMSSLTNQAKPNN
jgi:hypothetical protein